MCKGKLSIGIDSIVCDMQVSPLENRYHQIVQSPPGGPRSLCCREYGQMARWGKKRRKAVCKVTHALHTQNSLDSHRSSMWNCLFCARGSGTWDPSSFLEVSMASKVCLLDQDGLPLPFLQGEKCLLSWQACCYRDR